MCFSLSLRNEAMFHTDAAANITSRIRLEKSQVGCREKRSGFSCLLQGHQNQRDSLTQCCSSSFDQRCNPWTGRTGWTRRLGRTGCCCASHIHSHYRDKSWVHHCAHSLDLAHSFRWCFCSPKHVCVGGSLLDSTTSQIGLIQKQSAWLVWEAGTQFTEGMWYLTTPELPTLQSTAGLVFHLVTKNGQRFRKKIELLMSFPIKLK